MSEALVEVARADGIVQMRLARPAKGNSLSAGLVQALDTAVTACHGDGTRALIITAQGANFCTGFDLSDLHVETDDSLLARFVRIELLLQKIARAPFLTAAVAQGRAWGAGADLFAACGLRWATPDARFAFPGAGFGLVLGTGRLGALVGAARAATWILGGGVVSAQEAQDSGLVQQCADAATAEQAVRQALRQMLERLDAGTVARVGEGLRTRSAADDALDLARLVESAAVPGLKARIEAYRARAQR